MKIISYNVNGIRAALKKGFIDWLISANPDVLCLQEIKANKEQLDLSVFEEAGYKYNYWYSAQKKGYSGVAILSKIEPDHIEYGTGIEEMDFEGRNIRADFGDISVMSMYLPSGTNIDRLEFKFGYMDSIKTYLKELRIEKPNLVVCGDYNICHEAIDIHNPKMKGVFTRKAKKHKMSVQKYARYIIKKYKGKTKNKRQLKLLKQAVFAKTAKKWKKRKRKFSRKKRRK